jgi:hypothetical protein
MARIETVYGHDQVVRRRREAIPRQHTCDGGDAAPVRERRIFRCRGSAPLGTTIGDVRRLRIFATNG